MTTFMTDRSLKWRRGLHGLGQDSSVNLCDLYPAGCTATDTSGGGGVNWNSIVQQLTSAGINIGKTFTSYANPIYSLAPGTYYQQTPYGTVVSTTGQTPSTLNTGGMSTLLLLGGAVLLVVMLAKK